MIVPELAEIGDNYEFVNQFRPLWSAARAQDVKFCDEKTFPGSADIARDCLFDCTSLMTVNISGAGPNIPGD